MSYKLKIWALLRRIRDDHAKDHPNGFTTGDIWRYANEIDPGHSKRMVDCTFVASVTNLPGRLTTIGAKPSRSATIDLFYCVERGRYRPYDPAVDPAPLYFTGRRRRAATTTNAEAEVAHV
jgi:hypothetical protein